MCECRETCTFHGVPRDWFCSAIEHERTDQTGSVLVGMTNVTHCFSSIVETKNENKVLVLLE